ncbi:efflux RND transporter permease subunit [Gammaproteobacteria bacterium AH-315-C21]|nr:efflux RND transporter permease subunit [Gammaproteobacteria bacterium AH-315-C21]
MLNGLVILSFIRGLRVHGQALHEVIPDGALTCLHSVLMTALAAVLGFVSI